MVPSTETSTRLPRAARERAAPGGRRPAPL